MTDVATMSEPIARSQWQLVRRRFFKHKGAIFGLVILALLVIFCYGASWIAPYPKNHQDLDLVVRGAIKPDLLTPGWKHLFGVDAIGRDYFTETIYAGQISLRIGLVVALLSTFIGTAVGAIAGFRGKAIDQVLMRFTDLFLIVPGIAVLAIAVKKLGQSPNALVIVLAGLGWMTIARVVRGLVLGIKEREFVDAARVAGASGPRIVVRHILPNLVGPIIVNASIAMAGAILSESTLSFLGYGIKPPDTSWGNLLSDAESAIGTNSAFLIYFPGLMLVLTVLAINFVGDGIRDAFDPQGDRK